MYEELIEELRRHHCDAKEDDTQEVCEECAYDVIIADKSVPSGIASVCVCGLMNRAADAIEKLSREIRELPRWIPVTERLPENGDYVIAWKDEKPEGFVCICCFDKDGWAFKNITHWMPIPSAPSKEDIKT